MTGHLLLSLSIFARSIPKINPATLNVIMATVILKMSWIRTNVTDDASDDNRVRSEVVEDSKIFKVRTVKDFQH